MITLRADSNPIFIHIIKIWKTRRRNYRVQGKNNMMNWESFNQDPFKIKSILWISLWGKFQNNISPSDQGLKIRSIIDRTQRKTKFWIEKVLSEHIKNEVITLTSENVSSEYCFERKF